MVLQRCTSIERRVGKELRFFMCSLFRHSLAESASERTGYQIGIAGPQSVGEQIHGQDGQRESNSSQGKSGFRVV